MLTKRGFIYITLLAFFIVPKVFSQVSDSIFDLSCQQEDIIILEEKMGLNISGQKAYLMTANISDTLTIVINNTDGLALFQPFVLPRKLDELDIHHGPTVRNIDWEYDNIQIREFEAAIIGNKDELRKITIDKKTKTKRVLNNEGFFGEISQYAYFLDNLKVGDTISLSYIYDIDFRENWMRLLSNRIFFHGKYPKKSYDLSWCYHKDLVVDSLFVNHEIPEVSIEDNKICYHWQFKNLPGCLDEAASRPYKSLPHMVFVPKPWDLEYTHYDSFIREFVPIYFPQANRRQMELDVENWDNFIGNKNKNNLHYQKVADYISSLAPDDSLGIRKMQEFQQFMVNEVVYDPALDYYKHFSDHLKQKAGVDLWGRLVKDNNLERIYGNMILRLDLNFTTAYPIDKRVGEISRTYNPTVKDFDLMYAVALANNSLCYVIPKSDKNNYLFEEIPFYYENIPVMLLSISDFANFSQYGGKRNYNTIFRQAVTPSSKWRENYRNIQSKVSINTLANEAEFQTRVILSGQFSTLTRCVYLDKPIDSTINQRYFEPVWQIGDEIIVKSVKPTQPALDFPFKTTVMAAYTVSQPFDQTGNRFSFKPGKWFKLVYEEAVINKTRFLDYYPDFIGSDKYAYMLEFDKSVKLISIINSIIVENDYAKLNFSVQQIDDKKILLICAYEILSAKIEKDSINQVQEINQAIIDLSQLEIGVEIED